MAKKSTKVVNPNINIALLAAIAHAPGVFYVTKEEGEPLLLHTPPLIEVNTGMIDPSNPAKAAARLTVEGVNYLTQNNQKAVDASTETFNIISGAVLPPSKRGNTGGGAPVKYPFDKLEIGQSFFVPVSAKLPDPVKTLGSTVSSANMRYAEETGETKQVNRAKRDGKKAALDADGNKIMEVVTRPVYKYSRKFTIRGVKAGETYGNWTATETGALIQRIEVTEKDAE